MRYKIDESIKRGFFTASNLNFIITQGQDIDTGFIETESNPDIHDSNGTLYFSDNDDQKQVSSAKIVLPKRKFTSLYLAPYNGYLFLSNLWLDELRVRLAYDRLEASNLTLNKLDVMADSSYIDLSILGSISDYSYVFNCQNLFMEEREEDIAHPIETQGSIFIKNKGKTNVLFKGYKR